MSGMIALIAKHVTKHSTVRKVHCLDFVMYKIDMDNKYVRFLFELN